MQISDLIIEHVEGAAPPKAKWPLLCRVGR